MQTSQNLRLKKISLTTALLVPLLVLLIPFFATLISVHVNWGVFDFLLVALILIVASLSYRTIANKTRSFRYKAGVATGLVAYLLSTWMNLAVGIVGSPDNPINQIFHGFLLFSAICVVFGRFSTRSLFAAFIIPALSFLFMAGITFSYQEVIVVPIMCLILASLFVLATWLIRSTESVRR
ncbi:hypothetical protein OPS25_08220 [Alteromonas ponticola]|uniref:Uncharacterized protein n=1 Tax=Alteromonas aquimaris TaxID=2998417 RepID=A0ABT3P6T1_9ALTE|nr:hypothetical protein [Alteromonas aquimaris]MCW8108478.1 hypothetical protein [Alteromonas aquimaris]